MAQPSSTFSLPFPLRSSSSRPSPSTPTKRTNHQHHDGAVIPGGIGPTNATNNNSSSSNSNRRWISLALVMAAVLSAVAFRPRNNFLASFDAKSRGGSPPLLRRRESLETAFSEPHRTPYLERRGLDESVVDEWLGANTSCDLDYCQSSFNATTLCPGATFEEAGFLQKIPMWVQIVFLLVLLTFSALFSGLTLGLMSLDITGLEIVMAGDDPNAIKYAKKIYPLRKQGNLLLCTLLLGNVAVNSLMAIFSAQIFDGTIGFLASTISIVIFGEIIPQALCSRYALKIGSATVPIVKVIKYALYVFSWPLAKALDLALGRELATTYSNAEMIELLNVHVKENIIDQEEANAMAGALTYKNIPVRDAMTGIDKTFMLEVDEKLSFETIGKIFKTGYSRIPVFEISKSNIIGLLFVKDLIFLDPEDSVPVRSFVQIFGRSVHLVWPDDTLGDVLAVLKKGKSHLAVVRDVNNADEKQDPFYEVKGIITLEDIVERIIGDSIVDETDAYVDDKQSVRRDRGETFEWARLRLLDTKIVDEMLSASEIDAITAHLKANHSEPFQMLTDSQLTRLVSGTPVTTYPTATHELDKNLPNELLYEKNVQSDTFTLILSGKVTIFVGSENFRSDVSSWSVLGAKALEDTSWSPDYSAFVSDGPCRCIQIKRESFVAASDASVVERRVVAESETKSLRSQPHASTSYWVSDIVSTTSSNEVYEDAQTTSEQSMEGRVPNRRQDVLARLFPKNENGPIPDGDEHDEDEDDEDEHDDGSESAIQTKLSMDTKKYSL